jgi:hypothetical protein
MFWRTAPCLQPLLKNKVRRMGPARSNAAVWMFFDSGPYEAWLDVVVTGLFVIAVAIPALLWLTWRRNADAARDDSHLSFRDWAVGDFDTLTGPVKGANAAAEVLLPIAAVAVGMTVLGLVFHIIASGAA